jgi:hypothetical protein
MCNVARRGTPFRVPAADIDFGAVPPRRGKANCSGAWASLEWIHTDTTTKTTHEKLLKIPKIRTVKDHVMLLQKVLQLALSQLAGTQFPGHFRATASPDLSKRLVWLGRTADNPLSTLCDRHSSGPHPAREHSYHTRGSQSLWARSLIVTGVRLSSTHERAPWRGDSSHINVLCGSILRLE